MRNFIYIYIVPSSPWTMHRYRVSLYCCSHNLIRLNSFKRLPCPKDKMYKDEVFTDRFRYQLTMFVLRII